MKMPYLHLLKSLKLFLLILLSISFASGSEASSEYKVKKGDSLYTIAKKYHVNINDLKNANALPPRFETRRQNHHSFEKECVIKKNY
jgi:hypothetical protein